MIFNQKEYIQANQIQAVETFSMSSMDQLNIGKINFSLIDNKALSLPRTPYAGFEFNNEPAPQFIEAFFKDILNQLKEKKVGHVTINQSPEFYNGIVALNKSLISHGFHLSHEINHHIVLTQSWQQNINAMQMRRIKKCIKGHLVFKEESHSESIKIHQFIALCRQQQGLEINIDQQRFVQIVNALPNTYRLFSVKMNQNLVAALVTITVDQEIVYSFLPAFDRNYSEWSPLSFLFFNACQLLEQENMKILDLGISSIHGEPQTGLVKFKESMGGIQTLRGKYQLSIGQD